MVIRQCRGCTYLGLPGEFRQLHGQCRTCENRYRARYHKKHRKQCIRASVKSNREWRNRSPENRQKTREWNRRAYRNRVHGVHPTTRSMPS